VFAKACELGLEGVVSKRAGSRYWSGRSRQWLKSRNPAFVRERGRQQSASTQDHGCSANFWTSGASNASAAVEPTKALGSISSPLLMTSGPFVGAPVNTNRRDRRSGPLA